MRKRVLIMGAAGRDFHNFNTVFRDNPAYEVVGFTATQIPNISGRRYPEELSGKLYPGGIPIYSEVSLRELIRREKIDIVLFAYSDISFTYVMDRGSEVLSAGADYWLLGPKSTSLRSERAVIAVCAARTGSGKSPTTRKVGKILRELGVNLCVVRHPMPYGDLAAQTSQRFSSVEDLATQKCTIEEREEYEPHLAKGITVFAGVDYGKILKEVEGDFELILWDGGNNDFPFYEPNLLIMVVDPLRPGDETTFHPGATVLRMADIVVINKVDSAKKEHIELVRNNVKTYAPDATVIEARSAIKVSDSSLIEKKRVLVVEDGPTLTHGNMSFGAGAVAARAYHAEVIVDPRPYAEGSIGNVYRQYPHLDRILPAVGYGEEQIRELEKTINAVECDSVMIATPVDLSRLMQINKPMVRVTYELEEITEPDLSTVLKAFLKRAAV